MAEYIKRSELHDLVNNDTSFGLYKEDDSGCDVAFSISEVHKMIDKIPSADVVEVKHGKWEDGDVDGVGACGIEYRYNKCSVCGYEYSFPMKYYFCPNCGADMRNEGKG